MINRLFLPIFVWTTLVPVGISGQKQAINSSIVPEKSIIEAAIHFDRLGPREGLSHYTVLLVHQDQNGFMWFGTNKGLDRYDGHRVINFFHDPNDSSGLSYDRVSSIYESPDGVLWVGTDGGGLNQFDTQKVTFKQFLPSPESEPGSFPNKISCLAPVGDGEHLLVGTFSGLRVFNLSTGLFDKPSSLKNLCVSVPELESTVVHSVIYHQKQLMVGTDKGLYILSQQDYSFYELGEVRDLVLDPLGHVWVGYDRGVGRISHDTQKAPVLLLDIIPGMRDKKVNALDFDTLGYVWIGTQAGLIRYHLYSKDWVEFTYDKSDIHSLSYDNIFDIEVDSSGAVWIATWGGGISKTFSRTPAVSRIKHHSHQPGSLNNNEVMSLLEDGSGNVWVGTWNAGLNRLSKGSSKFHVYKEGPGSISSNSVTTLLEDREGRIWVGTRGGLNLFDPLKGQFRVFSFDPETNTRAHLIHALHQDERGDIWAGTSGGGLVRFNPDTQEYRVFRYGDGSGLSSNSIWAMADGAPGKIWVASSMGLNLLHIDQEHFDVFLHDNLTPRSLPHNRIQCLVGGLDEMLFIGTEGGGLAVFPRLDNTPKFQPIDLGSPSFNTVQSLQKDLDGSLWVGTDRNLIRISPDLVFKKYFDVVDGAQSRGYMLNSSLLDSKGCVWFGGLDGITIVDPSQVHESSSKGQTVITDFFLFNQSVEITSDSQGILSKPIHLTSQIELKYSDFPIAFEFSLLQYNKPDLHRFAYRMNGVDDIWIDTGRNTRRASYSHLDPGSYRFRVKGLNADGIWSKEASIGIQVLAPWWMNSWIWGGVAALLIVLGFWAQVIRLRRSQKSKLLLEDQVQRRTAELMEANRQLAIVSKSDPLTGLHNRRGFVEAAELEICRSQRMNRPLAIGLADIDFFKEVNDRYGHDSGDVVLKYIASLLRKGLRTHDIVGRWGGEEFIFLFSEAKMDKVYDIAERIRSVVEQSSVETDGQEINVTITIGLKEYVFKDTFEANLKCADEALYSGKEMGRNRVI